MIPALLIAHGPLPVEPERVVDLIAPLGNTSAGLAAVQSPFLVSLEQKMQLIELALESSTEDFQRDSLAWLERRIGFDGAIWGKGERHRDGGIKIEQFLLSGRPEGLIHDYPISAKSDPVSKNFIESPTALQNVSIHKHYRCPGSSQIREYLDHYRVRHLQIVGSVCSVTNLYSWIVCYREDLTRAFPPALEAVTKNAISTTLLAAQFHHSAQRQRTLEQLLDRYPEQRQGLQNLTPRQREVLHYIEQGWSNKLIAYHLKISENTLKSHMKLLFRALGVNSRTNALIAGHAIRRRAHD